MFQQILVGWVDEIRRADIGIRKALFDKCYEILSEDVSHTKLREMSEEEICAEALNKKGDSMNILKESGYRFPEDMPESGFSKGFTVEEPVPEAALIMAAFACCLGEFSLSQQEQEEQKFSDGNQKLFDSLPKEQQRQLRGQIVQDMPDFDFGSK